LTLWKKTHETNGHYCRAITFFRSPKNYDDDICLNLPFNFTAPWMSSLRNKIFKFYRGELGYKKDKHGFPPRWKPEGFVDKQFYRFKDWLWFPIVLHAIKNYSLYDFDVVHFESGTDFLKNEFFVKNLKRFGKKIICHYHGEDLRTRGVMPFIDNNSDLNLTNELDLLYKHPNINYLFLPFDTTQFLVKNKLNKVIKVCHAPTDRHYKGSDKIIKVCKKLEKEKLIQFDLIENQTSSETIKRKKTADLFIDQIGNRGGWGYGMNSVESLSMGICTLTELNNEYQKFIPDHPFININKSSLEDILRGLIKNKVKIADYGKNAKDWVYKKHDISQVSKKLYDYYKSIGIQI